MAGRRPRVLVVDDDPRFCVFVSSLLGDASLDVVHAFDANDAIASAQDRRPDAAILDIELPGVSGYGLCRELRNLFGADLPIIFVS